MKISKYVLPFIAVVTVISFTTSCSKEYVIPEPIEPVAPPCDTCTTTTATVFFATDIFPLFNSNGCYDCHGGGLSPALASVSSAYSELVPSYVTAGTPSTSYLYNTVAPGGDMTSYGYPFPPADLTTLSTWIEEGALNN